MDDLEYLKDYVSRSWLKEKAKIEREACADLAERIETRVQMFNHEDAPALLDDILAIIREEATK